MRNEFTAIVERDRRWYIAYCPEIPGANGQGKTKAAALKSLSDAIALILEDRRKDGLRGIPATATREKVVVGDAGRPAPPSEKARVSLETRRPGSFPPDQSHDGNRRGRAQAH